MQIDNRPEKPNIFLAANCNTIQPKRILLTIIPPSVYFIYIDQKVIIYNTLTILTNTFIIYWNFPILVTYTSMKPLYYDELFINKKLIPLLDVDDKSKEIFKSYYTWLLICTNSFLTTGLYHYWLYKTQDTTSIYEIVGVTGGIFKIFQMINHYFAMAALYFIHHRVQQKIYLIEQDSLSNEIVEEL